MNIIPTPNKYSGGNRMEIIVIHWWSEPGQSTLEGTISWLTNTASQVSAHYVVSGDKIYQLAAETDIAWHAQEANEKGIGIEIDPNTPGNTYKTVAWLVRDIRQRRGYMPLVRHNDAMAATTDCPGTISTQRIEDEINKLSKTTGGKKMVDEQQLNVIYRLRLGRSPDASAKKRYINKKTFATVEREIAKSNEYKNLIAAIKKNNAVSRQFLDHNIRGSIQGDSILVPRGSDASMADIKELEPGFYQVK